MAFLTMTYSFTNSTTADATQVNTNFQDVIDATSDGTIDFNVNALTAAGAAVLNGHVTLGSSSADDLTVNASLASSVPIKTTRTYDIGSADLGLRILYLGGNSTHTVALQAPSSGMSADAAFVLPAANAGAAGYYLRSTDTSGSTAWFNHFDPTGLTDVQATAAGKKTYLHGTTYNGGNAPTVTESGNGAISSVIRGAFVPYQMQDGSWRMKFIAVCSFNSASGRSITLNVAGILSKNVSGYYQAFSGYTNADPSIFEWAYTEPNTNNFNIRYQSNVTLTDVGISGDIELESKPSWAY